MSQKGLNMKVFLMPNWYSYSNINAYKANLFSGTLDYVKGEIEKENTQELQPYTITFEDLVSRVG